MSSPLLNYKFLSRPAKLKNAEKVFACECGKSYLSFPSLYLHFQKKHQMSISTKSTATNRISKLINGKIQQTYYYSKSFSSEIDLDEEQNFGEGQNMSENEELKNFQFDLLEEVFNRFLSLEEFRSEITLSKQRIKEIFSELLSYLKSQKEEIASNIYEQTDGFQVRNLPYFFNPFIQKKTLLLGCSLEDNRIVTICSILKYLAKWLKIHKYTDLVIEYNCSMKY